jgi:hypothetical protein
MLPPDKRATAAANGSSSLVSALPLASVRTTGSVFRGPPALSARPPPHPAPHSAAAAIATTAAVLDILSVTSRALLGEFADATPFALPCASGSTLFVAAPSEGPAPMAAVENHRPLIAPFVFTSLGHAPALCDRPRAAWPCAPARAAGHHTAPRRPAVPGRADPANIRGPVIGVRPSGITKRNMPGGAGVRFSARSGASTRSAETSRPFAS